MSVKKETNKKNRDHTFSMHFFKLDFVIWCKISWFFLIALFAESVLDDVRIRLMIHKIYKNLILTFMEAVPYRGSYLCRNI